MHSISNCVPFAVADRTGALPCLHRRKAFAGCGEGQRCGTNVRQLLGSVIGLQALMILPFGLHI